MSMPASVIRFTRSGFPSTWLPKSFRRATRCVYVVFCWCDFSRAVLRKESVALDNQWKGW